MKGCAQLEVFSKVEIAAYELARSAVEKLPDENWCGHGPLRCHELARVISKVLMRQFPVVCNNCRRAAASSDGRTSHGIVIGPCNCDMTQRLAFRVIDGKVGCVEHSWITLPGAWHEKWGNAILDPYCPGRVPLVQLVDATVQMVPSDRRVEAGVKLRLRQQYEPGEERDDIQRDVIAAVSAWLL